MKLLLLVFGLLFTKTCLCQETMQSLLNPPGWNGLTDENIDQYRSLFKSIEGISPQAVNDLVNVIIGFRNNYAIVIYIEKVVDDVLIKGLNADIKKLDVADVEQYFSEFNPWAGSDIILQIVETIFSQRLTPSEKTRAMTFIRGFKIGASTDEIRAALSYLYGEVDVKSAANISIHISMLMCCSLMVAGKFLMW